MRILFSNNNQFRNDEHFQFITEVKDLIADTGADTIKIETLFDAFLLCYTAEDEALKKIVKRAVQRPTKYITPSWSASTH